MDLDDWAGAVNRYAGRLHGRAGQGHHVRSPFGAWMAVALRGTKVSDEQARVGLADVLGADPLWAAAFAARLLGDPHPLIAAGADVWVPSGHGRRAAQSTQP